MARKRLWHSHPFQPVRVHRSLYSFSPIVLSRHTFSTLSLGLWLAWKFPEFISTSAVDKGIRRDEQQADPFLYVKIETQQLLEQDQSFPTPSRGYFKLLARSFHSGRRITLLVERRMEIGTEVFLIPKTSLQKVALLQC